jgi:hypothetical protein
VIWLGHRVFLSALLTGNRSAGQEHLYAILRIPQNPRAREDPQIMKKMILKTLTRFNMNLRNSTNHAPSLRGSLLIPLLIGCFPLLPKAQATPEKAPAAPETALPGFNTADGDHALFSLTTGSANAAVGWFSLFSNTDGSFNTAVGAGTLLFNTASNNTAFGAAALLFNTTGTENTAVGTAALLNNTEGIRNTAIGSQALANNTDDSNTAVGADALSTNTTGVSTWPSVVSRSVTTPKATATRLSGLVRSSRRPVVSTRP